ncbi:hypothetical protein PBCVMA1E_205R, partial [Paramecium bursaria Chlorella virus MA1E]
MESANKNWSKVQNEYDTLISSGKKHDDVILILRKKWSDIGPMNAKRLQDGYKPQKPKPPAPKPPTPDPKPPVPSQKQTEAGLKPVVITVDGRHHAYQSPANPKGLVVFLHGCSRSIFGAWPRSSNPKFFGYSEDVSRTKQVLKAGYAILYISPTD